MVRAVRAVGAVQRGDSAGEPCQFITAKIPYYTTQSYSHEVRFVQNDWAPHGNRSVGEFIDYIDLVNANYTWSDGGWSAWYDRRMGLVPKAVRPGVKLRPSPLLRYDRHMGLMFKTCPLDKYMLKFNEQNIAFHTARLGDAEHGQPTDHWTEGVQGYGIEMQGTTYEYKDCYPVRRRARAGARARAARGGGARRRARDPRVVKNLTSPSLSRARAQKAFDCAPPTRTPSDVCSDDDTVDCTPYGKGECQ